MVVNKKEWDLRKRWTSKNGWEWEVALETGPAQTFMGASWPAGPFVAWVSVCGCGSKRQPQSKVP
jgi:hypothetical protein